MIDEGIRWGLRMLMAVFFLMLMRPLIDNIRDLRESRQLKTDGVRAEAMIVRQFAFTGRFRDCWHWLEVEYRVEAQAYSVMAKSCTQDLTGKPLEVVYLPTRPAVADVLAPAHYKVESARGRYGSLLMLLGIQAAVLAIALWRWE